MKKKKTPAEPSIAKKRWHNGMKNANHIDTPYCWGANHLKKHGISILCPTTRFFSVCHCEFSHSNMMRSDKFKWNGNVDGGRGDCNCGIRVWEYVHKSQFFFVSDCVKAIIFLNTQTLRKKEKNRKNKKNALILKFALPYGSGKCSQSIQYLKLV